MDLKEQRVVLAKEAKAYCVDKEITHDGEPMYWETVNLAHVIRGLIRCMYLECKES